MPSTQRTLVKPEDLESATKSIGAYDQLTDGYYRIVYTRQQDGPWRFCAGQCVLGTNAGGDLTEDYPAFTFVSRTFHSTSLVRIIDALSGAGGIEIAHSLPPLRLPQTHPSWKEEIVPSHATAFGLPVRRYRIAIESNAVFSNDQLVSYSLPYRSSAANYGKAFLGLKPQDSVDGQKGDFVIDVPDRRGAIQLTDQCLSIVGATTPLRLVGEVDGVPVDVTNSGAFELLDGYMNTAELWLLASDGDLVDYISTSQWPFKYAPPAPEAEQEPKYLDLIGKGESETCEFKPYIDLANTKAVEIEASVCAFSNQLGGTIFIGVSKEAEIDGISRELAKSPDQIDSAISDYVRRIRSRLQEGLKDNQCYSINIVRLRGASVVAIEVEKTREINYLLRSGVTNLAYIRHGATNMRMSPPEIRAAPPPDSDTPFYDSLR